MNDHTDRLKIREYANIDCSISKPKPAEENPEFVWHKDERLEYQHAIMKSHIGFARFYLEHSGSEPPLSDQRIYELWQEKSIILVYRSPSSPPRYLHDANNSPNDFCEMGWREVKR